METKGIVIEINGDTTKFEEAIGRLRENLKSLEREIKEAVPAKLFVVGKWIEGAPWQLGGVFSTEAAAVAACPTREYFVGPVPLDEALPEGTIPWPGAYYPLAEVEGKETE